jgi:signal transduction histidine kinase
MERIAKPLATTVWLVTLALVAGGLVLTVLNRATVNNEVLALYLIFWPSALAFASVGALVARRHPRNAVGWLFGVVGFGWAFLAFGDEYAVRAFATVPGSLPLAGWIGYASGWVPLLTYASIPLVFLLFPNGRPRSRRWGLIVRLLIILITVVAVAILFHPGSTGGNNDRFVHEGFRVRNPLGVGSLRGVLSVVAEVCGVAILALSFASIGALYLRLRQARGEERQQLRWLAYVGVATAAWFPLLPLALAFGEESLFGPLFWYGIGIILGLGIPVASGVAILRYRLYDLDIVVKKTVVFGALLAFGGLVYLAVVVGIGTAVGERGDSALTLAAAAIVAFAFQPLRTRALRFADRLVYGRRATPYEVLAEFSDRMTAAYSIEAVLPRMAETVAEATGATHSEVWLRVGGELRREASWPEVEDTRAPVGIGELDRIPGDGRFPVTHRDELLGALAVTTPPSEPLTPSQEKLLRDLASQAGLVLRNVRLVEEVRASRQRLVAAQDERAKALERNLHDGAQQQLVALAVKLRLARASAQKEGAGSTADLLDGLARDANDALENLRDLARGIYPPLLADKGLPTALEAQARRGPVPVEIQTDGVRRYPQEVESAAYFCVLEALNNVAKYAGASRAAIRLFEREARLTFEVADDGSGFDVEATSYGTGLQGMADRLDAIGGELQVRSTPGSGTTITGGIPLGR